uniref:Putative secreted protein n=1 Tax=Anopheles marajoara TaxID=58244 RepID=A0A2M4CB34_9DIPT
MVLEQHPERVASVAALLLLFLLKVCESVHKTSSSKTQTIVHVECYLDNLTNDLENCLNTPLMWTIRKMSFKFSSKSRKTINI